MILEELQARYGSFVAERIRQGLTLRTFSEIEIEELVPHFELIAERSYEEFNHRRSSAQPKSSPASSKQEYLDILRRRWQEAEELAHLILEAEEKVSEAETGQISA